MNQSLGLLSSFNAKFVHKSLSLGQHEVEYCCSLALMKTGFTFEVNLDLVKDNYLFIGIVIKSSDAANNRRHMTGNW
jgi:hypothetical protein